MQTFLPYRNFEKSAKCLDFRRLGKQRIEAKQILDILLGRTKSKAWINHPAVRMWRGYELALQEYYNTVVREWVKRGYKNTMELELVDIPNIYLQDFFVNAYSSNTINIKSGPTKHPDFKIPAWLTEEFCASHRAALLCKFPEWYSRFGWIEKPEINYVWPID
jgi:hypothetical protein